MGSRSTMHQFIVFTIVDDCSAISGKCNASKIIYRCACQRQPDTMEPQEKKAPSESITLRISKHVLDRIRKEADNKEISLNTLANQIFTHHVDWNNDAPKAGMVSFPKPLLERIIEKHSEREVSEIAEYIAKNHVKNIILMLRKENSIEAFLDVIESWVRASGFPFMHEHDKDSSTHSFVIQHDLNKKWSLYLAELFKFMFAELGTKDRGSFEVTDSMLMFKIQSK